MLEFLEGIGSGSVQAFWMPVLVWTGLAGAVVLGLAVRDRFGRRAFFVGNRNRQHPLAGYRLRQGLLLALPASVLAEPWVPTLWWWESELLSPVLSSGVYPAVISPRQGGVPVPSVPVPTRDVVAVLLGGGDGRGGPAGAGPCRDPLRGPPAASHDSPDGPAGGRFDAAKDAARARRPIGRAAACGAQDPRTVPP